MWNRKKKRTVKMFLCMCVLVAGMMFQGSISYAAGNGSLQIEYCGKTKEDEEIQLSQAEFAYYYVGKMQDGEWKTAGEFEKSGVSLKGELSSERGQQAEALYEYAVKKNISGNVVTTDENGVAWISGLEDGLYLVASTKDWTSEGIGTFHSAPFLVSMPALENGEPTWTVKAKPKSEWGPEDQKPSAPEQPDQPQDPEKPGKPENSDEVQTGDKLALMQNILIMSGSLLIIFIMRKELLTGRDEC